MGELASEGHFLYKVIQASRLYEQIVQQIEGSILNGELSEGSQLPAERDLAKQFGVSRTAVREAIKALQEKGLVDAFPGRGTTYQERRTGRMGPRCRNAGNSGAGDRGFGCGSRLGSGSRDDARGC